MARRAPVWLTVLPLIAGAVGYYALWTTYADVFQQQLARQLHGQAVAVTGFPYRVSATVASPRIGLAVGGLHAEVQAGQLVADRTPWRPELTVLRLTGVQLHVGGVRIVAPAALASVRVERGRLARISVVYDHPQGSIAGFGVRFVADRLETHLRRAPQAAGAELVASGSAVRIDGGDPLSIEGTGRSDAGGGAIIATLTLGDRTGEVVAGRAAVIETVCPASVAAAVGGAVSAREYRLRQPARSGLAAPVALPDSARRLQLPPCPVLRGALGGPQLRRP